MTIDDEAVAAAKRLRMEKGENRTTSNARSTRVDGLPCQAIAKLPHTRNEGRGDRQAMFERWRVLEMATED